MFFTKKNYYILSTTHVVMCLIQLWVEKYQVFEIQGILFCNYILYKNDGKWEKGRVPGDIIFCENILYTAANMLKKYFDTFNI